MTNTQAQLTQVLRAGPEHAFALAALELQHNREQGYPGEDGFLARWADAWLADLDRRPTWIALALDGRPLGTVMTTHISWLPRPGRETQTWVHVDNLFVTPGSRRQGIGERLMRAAIDWCRDEDILYLQLTTTDDGAGLYRRLGFRNGEAMLRKVL